MHFLCAYVLCTFRIPIVKSRVFHQDEGVGVACYMYSVYSMCESFWRSKFTGVSLLSAFNAWKEWVSCVYCNEERKRCYVRHDKQRQSFAFLSVSWFYSLACLDIKPPVNQITAHLYFLTLQHLTQRPTQMQACGSQYTL